MHLNTSSPTFYFSETGGEQICLFRLVPFVICLVLLEVRDLWAFPWVISGDRLLSERG